MEEVLSSSSKSSSLFAAIQLEMGKLVSVTTADQDQLTSKLDAFKNNSSKRHSKLSQLYQELATIENTIKSLTKEAESILKVSFVSVNGADEKLIGAVLKNISGIQKNAVGQLSEKMKVWNILSSY
jgi:septal ring factor EnvC (AmiA/AmiB activator)